MLKRGYLSAHFTGVGTKRLTEVDANPASSNQHEITGSRDLMDILGDNDCKIGAGEDHRLSTTYMSFSDEDEAETEEGKLSWYDARRNRRPRTEWRLYYQSNAITKIMKPGDVIFIARRPDGHLLFIVTQADSTIHAQLAWLFGIASTHADQFDVRPLYDAESQELNFTARSVLSKMGIEVEPSGIESLDQLIQPFGNRFPTTREFSTLARNSLPDVIARDDPDAALMAWLEREELLFRRLERKIVADRLRSGFATSSSVDVDGFIAFSLSVQNRRKSRAGHSLENHLEALFVQFGLSFDRGAETENRNKLDFLFPGRINYLDPAFDPARLLMLGAKSTLKDRWRQVLAEAVRIPLKHLATLEPGISKNQTDQMHANRLQLVIPTPLQKTFSEEQAGGLMSLSEFIQVARSLADESPVRL